MQPAQDLAHTLATPPLEARGLVKAFGGLRAVDGMSVALARGELLGLIGAQQTQADANVHAVGVFDFPDNITDVIQLAFIRSAAAGDDTECPGLAFLRFASTFEQSLLVLEHVAIDFSLGDLRLRAIVAIFGAQATLGVAQIVELDPIGMVVVPNSKRGGQQRGDFDIGAGQHLQRFCFGQVLTS